MTLERSGRTTRMLEAAIAEAKKGHYVMVYAASHYHAEDLQKQCAEMTGQAPYATEVDVGAGVITFESVGSLNWETLRSRAAFPTIPTFVDHYAIEQHIGHLVKEMHRWDAPITAIKGGR